MSNGPTESECLNLIFQKISSNPYQGKGNQHLHRCVHHWAIPHTYTWYRTQLLRPEPSGSNNKRYIYHPNSHKVLTELYHRLVKTTKSPYIHQRMYNLPVVLTSHLDLLTRFLNNVHTHMLAIHYHVPPRGHTAQWPNSTSREPPGRGYGTIIAGNLSRR
jgi:hypothetical protein